MLNIGQRAFSVSCLRDKISRWGGPSTWHRVSSPSCVPSVGPSASPISPPGPPLDRVHPQPGGLCSQAPVSSPPSSSSASKPRGLHSVCQTTAPHRHHSPKTCLLPSVPQTQHFQSNSFPSQPPRKGCWRNTPKSWGLVPTDLRGQPEQVLKAAWRPQPVPITPPSGLLTMSISITSPPPLSSRPWKATSASTE